MTKSLETALINRLLSREARFEMKHMEAMFSNKITTTLKDQDPRNYNKLLYTFPLIVRTGPFNFRLYFRCTSIWQTTYRRESHVICMNLDGDIVDTVPTMEQIIEAIMPRDCVLEVTDLPKILSLNFLISLNENLTSSYNHIPVKFTPPILVSTNQSPRMAKLAIRFTYATASELKTKLLNFGDYLEC